MYVMISRPRLGTIPDWDFYFNSEPTLAAHKESMSYRVPGQAQHGSEWWWCMARCLSENGGIFYILITEIDKLIS